MKITLLPATLAGGPGHPQQFLTSYVINDAIAIDAGGLGFYGEAAEQARVKHIFITHTHIDHIASLPIFVENVYDGIDSPVTIYGSQEVLECLRRDVFNGRVWPDFINDYPADAPFMNLLPLRPEVPISVLGLTMTPVPVHHAVPTLGFLIEDATTTVAIPSDTGPTERFWQLANARPNLKGVFLETAFPNSQEELANVSCHLTPRLFRKEVNKLATSVPIWAVHFKARFREQIIAELRELRLPNLEMAQFGKPYYF